MKKTLILLVIVISMSVGILSCGSSGSSATTYTVGGTLSGLATGVTVVLQNNSGDDKPLEANGSFTFSTALADGAAYSVAVSTQPTNMTCTVTNGSGTISAANVTNVSVSCVFSVKVIFITAATTTGNIKASSSGTGIAAADALCAADTNKPDAGTYKAMIVDGTNRVACTTAACSGGTSENVDWVLAASTAYYRANATTKIGTTTARGVFNVSVAGGMDNSFSATAYNIWTNLNGDWTTASSGICSSWASADSLVSSTWGDTSGTSGSTPSPISNMPAKACSESLYLACVEQ